MAKHAGKNLSHNCNNNHGDRAGICELTAEGVMEQACNVFIMVIGKSGRPLARLRWIKHERREIRFGVLKGKVKLGRRPSQSRCAC
jgi:hypothetical protein